VRRTTSTIKRVQDLLTTRRGKRFEKQSGRFTADGRAARLDGEARRDEAFAAGRPVPPMPGPPGGGT
jgi:hypothetical protein